MKLMKIDTDFFKKRKKNNGKTLDDLLRNGEKHPPRPWDVANGVHPHVFTCNQGDQEFWQCYLWMPFWCTLSSAQQEEIKKEAPDQDWIEWLELRSQFCENFLENEKIKTSEQNLPKLCYYTRIVNYKPMVLWGIPFMVILATLLSLFPASSLFFKYSSPFIYLFTLLLQATFVATCTKYIIKLSKMRSPELAYRLTGIGFCLGCVISLLLAVFIVSSQTSIELIVQNIYNSFRNVGWFMGFRYVFFWFVWLGVFMCIVFFGTMLQVYQPYSEAGDKWCRRLKLPYQRLAVNKNGLTPYQEKDVPYDPNEYELIDGILLPKKADPVCFFKFFTTPCLRIVIYFDESAEHNYIHIIFRRGLNAENIGIPLAFINQVVTKQIIERFSIIPATDTI